MCFSLDMTPLQPYNTTAYYMFLTEDMDGDGCMTVAEIDAVFFKYDKNGTLSRGEGYCVVKGCYMCLLFL